MPAWPTSLGTSIGRSLSSTTSVPSRTSTPTPEQACVIAPISGPYVASGVPLVRVMTSMPIVNSAGTSAVARIWYPTAARGVEDPLPRVLGHPGFAAQGERGGSGRNSGRCGDLLQRHTTAH